ncbi:alpha/beta fold hydrolase [Pigmentiphaga sp.]|uniref:alpha/beta fold hydrolase n=1 Tax=Pigmentiphaga sp. TaxID=1977564 RepID=UPI0025DFB96F|nr:alpha/beta fold hydrolase [Pigmentiphaga sp.]
MNACLREHVFELDGIPVRYVEGGAGLPLLLLHGSGAGASSHGNWQRVLPRLAERHHVHAMDLIGFGRSGAKPAGPHFDYALWLRQCREMIARMPGARIGVIGHSLSGTLALRLAACEPRVARVMTTATMGASFAANPATETAWRFPRDRETLRQASCLLVHDPALIDETYLDGRERILREGDHGRRFEQMFAGDKQRFIDAVALTADELGAIGCEVLMLHGRDDRGFPADVLTLPMSRSIARADVHLLSRCGHSVAFEWPEKFLALAVPFFAGVAHG